MQKADWSGVFPAITTPFTADGAVDEAFLTKHVAWLLDAGCTGVVALGSLGEGATLTAAEKVRILEVCGTVTKGRVPLVASISGLSTAECVSLAKEAARVGCDGLMVLPPYVYLGDWRETEAHYSSVLDATPLSCMLYNNPIAYGTDLSAEQIGELAHKHRNVHAVKESSGDVRRITAVRSLLGSKLALFAGLDDMIVEALAVGADGWVAGLVNALPSESVTLVNLAKAGRIEEALKLYAWFLPLLRFDTVPKFVQLIKLVQAEVGMGNERVRAPRLQLPPEEREVALKVVRKQLAHRADA
ncbi:MAG: dihydrodipicolinate synthase family protein [Gemmatimonadales bacterium]